MGDHDKKKKKKNVLILVSGTQTTMNPANTSSPERPGRSEAADPTGASGSREGPTYIYEEDEFPKLGDGPAPMSRRARAAGRGNRGGDGGGSGSGNVGPISAAGSMPATDGGSTVKDVAPADGTAVEEAAEVTAVGPIAGGAGPSAGQGFGAVDGDGSAVNKGDQEGGPTVKDATPVPADVTAIINIPDTEEAAEVITAVGPIAGGAGPSAGPDGRTEDQEPRPPSPPGWSPWDWSW